MLKAIIENKDYYLPQNWNEFTNEQLLFLQELLSQETTSQEVKTKMLLFCLGLSYDFNGNLRLNKKKCPIVTEDIYLASRVFDFLFFKEDEKEFLNIQLTRCPFPKINKMICGGEALTEISYEQFIYLLSFQQIKENNKQAIYDFIACLYTHENEKFSPKTADPIAFEKLSQSEIQLLEWYWLGSLEYLSHKFPRVFAGNDSSNSATESVYDSQQRLLDVVCDGDATKKAQYKADNLYNVLSSIEYLLEKRENEKV